MRRMRGLSIAALIIAVISVALSVAALWKANDASSSASKPTSTTSTTAPALVPVPDVNGQNALTAGAHLKDARLESKIVNAPSVSVGKGRVISQNPPPDTKVPRGTVVTLTVSTGPT